MGFTGRLLSSSILQGEDRNMGHVIAAICTTLFIVGWAFAVDGMEQFRRENGL